MSRASLVTQTVKNLPAMQETSSQSMHQEDSPEGENGNPLWYACLENPMDRGAWWATAWWDRKESDMSDQLKLNHVHNMPGLDFNS